MADIYGTVVRLTNNKGVSKAGKPYTTHGAVVKTTSGEDMEVDFGFTRPTVEQGGFYKLTVEKNYGKWGVKSVEAASENSAPKTSAPASSGRNPGKVFPVPVDHPDRSIIRQNALAHATRLVVDSGKVNAMNLDAGEAAELIVKTAYIFEDYATGDREERAIKEELTDGKA